MLLASASDRYDAGCSLNRPRTMCHFAFIIFAFLQAIQWSISLSEWGLRKIYLVNISCALTLVPCSPPCTHTKETLIQVTCSNPMILKYSCSHFEGFYWTIWWQRSTEAEAGQFQNDSSKNIRSPFVRLPPLGSGHLCLTHCLSPFMITAPEDFPRAGSMYGFICSWVLGGKGLFQVLTNSTLTLLTQKSYYFFYIFLSFVFILFLFSGPTLKGYF